jgi:hypothetical protein
VLQDNRGKFHLHRTRRRALLVQDLSQLHRKEFQFGGTIMSGQVILYFDDQADALRFALAAGSVMAGDGASVTDDLLHETARVSRIRLDAVNASAAKKPAA